MKATLMVGDVLERIKEIDDATVDSIVTDPPYELGFMGKAWDKSGIAVNVDMWRECLRVLKPGGYLLAFGGSRTYHRMACAIKDAGFEIRDQIMWIYGSGFPKSLDVSKAIDKAAGQEKIVGSKPDRWTGKGNALNFSTDRPQAECKVTVPATPSPMAWQGWGTALKPAHEPICVARKPIDGTVAANVLKHGTGALNIDSCRVRWPDGAVPKIGTPAWGGPAKKLTAVPGQHGDTVERTSPSQLGRWPANVIHDGSEEVMAAFPDAPGQLRASDDGPAHPENVYGQYGTNGYGWEPRDDEGSAARFFYCAKADREERNRGCYDVEEKPLLWSAGTKNPGSFQSEGTNRSAQNNHPTVKPIDLMRWLCRLVTPPHGLVFDPFTGSGTTGIAALLEEFNFMGVELSPEYIALAEKRIRTAAPLLNTVEVLS
jgi:site-specific DNA-methyltransferase (adenine-specific)